MWLLMLVPLTAMLAGTWLILEQLGSSPPHLGAPFALYPVSILKPLKGSDPGLEENLEGFFRLDFPDYELIFSVADPRDRACNVIWRLIGRYPCIISRCRLGWLSGVASAETEPSSSSAGSPPKWGSPRA